MVLGTETRLNWSRGLREDCDWSQGLREDCDWPRGLREGLREGLLYPKGFMNWFLNLERAIA
jgi:hypothetical protein